MKKIYHHFHLLLLLLLFSSGTILAQVPQFFTGNVNNPSNSFPFNVAGGKAMQSLVLPGEFTNANAGFITKFYVQGTASVTPIWTNLEIKMAQSPTMTTLPTTSFYSGPFTTVLAAPSLTQTSTAAGWMMFTLQTPFRYDPSQSLIIEISQCAMTGGAFTVTNVGKTGFRRTWNAAGCNTTYNGQDANLFNCGIDIAPPVPNDMAMLGIDTPASFNQGLNNVVARIRNVGSNRVNFISLNWSLNGVNQTPVIYNSILDTIGGPGVNTALVNLGTVNFLNNVTYRLRAWTYGPNGINDSIPVNDTSNIYFFRSPLSGNYTVGNGGDFQTLTEAANTINVAGVSGAVTFTLIDNLYSAATGEVFPITFRQYNGMSPTNTLTIKPSLTSTPLITDSNNTALIIVDGVKYLTLDGKQFPSDVNRNITFENRSTGASSIIRYSNDAINAVVRNIVFRSSTTGTSTLSSCLYIGGTSQPIPTGNDNISIVNNLFARSSGLAFTQGVVVEGSSIIAQNNDITIDSNLFQGFTLNGILVAGTGNGNGSNFNIRYNSFYDTAATNSTNTMTCINFIPGTGSLSNNNVISDNMIGGDAPNISGGGLNRWLFATTHSGSFNGITVTSGTGTGTQIVRNNIRNIRVQISTSGPSFNGISITGGVAVVGGSLPNANVIGHPTDTHNITSFTTTGTVNGINTSSSNDITISHNTVQNISLRTASSNILTGIRISTGSSNTYIINSNRVRALSSVTTSTGTTTGIPLCGILNSASSPNISITNNIIGGSDPSDTICLQSGSAGRMAGILTGAGTNSLTGNTVNGLRSYSTTTGTTTSSAIYGIATTLTVSGQSVTNNTVTNISKYNANASSIHGVYLNGAGHIASGNTISNLFNNSTNTSVTNGASVCGLTISSGTAAPQVVQNNTIFNLENPNNSANQVNGIIITNSSAITVRNNTVRNIRGNGTSTGGSVVGINVQTSQINQVIENNLVHSLSSYNTGGTPITIGVMCTGSNTINGNNSSVSGNIIHSFHVGASVASNNNMQAIQLTGNALVSNNLIRIGRDSAGNYVTRPTLCRPIIINSSGAAQVRVYHNNVVLDAQPAAGTGSTTLFTAAIEVLNTISSPGFVDIRNNIFSNTTTNSGTSTLNHYVMKLPATSTNITSDFNIYHNAPGANQFIGARGTTNYPLLADVRAALFMDGSSGYGNPQFLNSTGDASTVDVRLATNNPAEKSGDPLTASFVTTDVDGNTRSSATPTDIGATSGNNTLTTDIIAPSISYTVLSNTPFITNRSISATIFDAGGLRQLADTPRIYYRKNSGTWFNQMGVLTSGNYNNGVWDFVIDYSLVGTPTTNDTISYFIAAVDSSGNLNSRSMYAAGPISALTTVPALPQLNFYRITDPIPPVVTVGSGGTYTTLTGPGGLFDVLNNSVVQGNTEVLITGNISEPGTFALNRWVESGVGSYTLTIRPQSNTQVILSGTNANTQGLIRLNGTLRVNILGWSPSGTNADTNLIIRASAASTPAIGFINGGGSDSMMNVIFESRSTSTTNGCVYVGGSASGNISNLVIQGCHIRQDQTLPATLVANGFFGTGTIPVFSSNIKLINNQIYNYSGNGIISNTATGGGWQITGNHFYHNAISPITTAVTNIGFQPGSSSDNNIISNNFIGGTAPFAGGAPVICNGTYVGMTISTGFSTGTIVQNNVIDNIALSASSTGLTGIFVTGTPAVYTVTGNRIGSLTGNSISLAGNGRIQGINSNAAGNVTITNDSIINILNTSTGTSSGITGINVASGSGNTTVISNNYLYSLVLTGSTNTGTTTAAALQGICLQSSSLTQTISNNTLQTLVNTGNAAHQMFGIMVTQGVTTVQGNSIYGMRSSSTSANTGGSTTPIIGIARTSSNTGVQITSNNTVDSIAYASGSPASVQIIGISQTSSTASITGNTIRNIYTQTISTGTSTASGVCGILYSGGNVNNIIERNVIHSFMHNNAANSSSNMIGILYSGSTAFVGNSSSISRNFIHSLGSGSTGTVTLTGIHNVGGYATYSNNMIRVGIDAGGNIPTEPRNLKGITHSATTQSQYYHNSILINGTPGSGSANTAAIEFLTQIAVGQLAEVRNNILVNNSVNSGTATGKNWCVKLFDSLRINSNYNLYFHSTSVGANAFLGGTTLVDYTTLSGAGGWKAILGMDMASGFGDPNFDASSTGTASVATLALQGNNPAEKSGDPTLTSVTTDYYGNTRSTLTPYDIGAHAGNFNQSPDIFPPVITLTPLLNSGTLTGIRVLSGVNIKDNNGIPTTGLTRPVVYYSKDGSNWYSSSASQVSGTAVNADATFQIDYTPMLPLTISDTIRYYVLVQDNAGNVISNSPFAIATGVSAVISHPVNPLRYTFLPIVPANSVFSVGAGQTYTSLTNPGGFFEFINGRTLGGNITAEITSDINNESGLNMLNAFAEDGTGGYTLTIRPASGTSSVRTIEGTPANNQNTTGGLMILNGASRVTISGIPTGGSNTNKYLRIRNRNTAGPAIELRNGASANRINNCLVEGGSASTTTGVVSIVVLTGNTSVCSNDTISNCLIGNNAAATLPSGIPTFAIYSNGQPNYFNTNGVITGNEIYNFGNSGAVLDVNNGDGWQFTNNSFYNNLPISITTTQFAPINLVPNQNGSGCIITGNFIGGSGPNCSGTWNHTGATNFFGIRTSTGIGSDVIIRNNTIQNLNFNVPSTNAINAITALGGNTIIGGTPAQGNLVGSITNPNSIIYSSFGANIGIQYNGTNSAVISGNTVCGIQTGVAGQSSSFIGINASNGAISSCSNNIVGSTTMANSITNAGTSTTTGIFISTSATLIASHNVTNNTIANMFASGNQTSVGIRGITLSNGNTSVPICSNNTIFNLSTNSSNITSGNNTAVMGINIVLATNAIPVVSNNTIYALRALNTGAVNTNVSGILLQQAQSPVINANRIYDLTNASTSTSSNPAPTVSGINLGNTTNVSTVVTNNQITLGSGNTANSQFIGIWQQFSNSSITSNIINNSVVITGTSGGGNQNTYGFLRGNNSGNEIATLLIIRNNIFANNRSGGGGNHYAIANQANVPTNNTWFGTSSNYNLFVTNNAASMGQWGLNSVTMNNWLSSATSDNFSYYALSTSGTSNAEQVNLNNLFTNIASGNLQLNAANAEAWYAYGKGISGSTINNLSSDFNGNARPVNQGVASTIGSVQLSTPPAAAPIAAVASAAPAANTTTNYIFGSRQVASVQWGASAPTTASLLNYTGVNPPGTAAVGNNFNRYIKVDVAGGTPPYNYGVTIHYDAATLGGVTSASNLKVAKESAGTNANPTWSVQPVSTVNLANNTLSAAGLSSTAGFTSLFFSGNENTAPPTISAFTPSAREAGGNVTIRGALFTGATAVSFNGVSQPTFTVVNDTSITTTVPFGATTGPVSVTNPYGTGTSSTNFTVIPVPTLSSFTPSSGTFGTVVTITGTGFTWATQVQFNGVNASSFTIVNNTTITATLPNTATSGSITVINPAGNIASGSSFTVIGVPTISGFTPGNGAAGTLVTITGTNFNAITNVRFNGTDASYTVNSSTNITATVPSSATSGTITVVNGSGTGTSGSSFTVLQLPTVTGFNPSSGSVGTSVVISGTNFTSVDSVEFGGGANASFTVNSATQITATVPAGAASGAITVYTNAGSASSATNFTIISDLVVSTAQNVSGTYNNITITGTGDATLTGSLVALGNVLVQTGGTVRFGINNISGNGNFTAQSGSKLYIGSAQGISATSFLTGNILVNGNRSYHTSASYIYNGIAAQVTGNGLPSSLDSLTIDNANGVTLSQNTTVSNRITFVSGRLHLGNNNITVNGNISGAGSASYFATTNTSGSTGVLRLTVPNNNTPVNFPVGGASYTPVQITLTAGSTSDVFGVRVFNGVLANGLSGAGVSSTVVNRTWVISENTSGGSNATVNLTWDDTLESVSFARGNCGVFYVNGGSWNSPSSFGAATGSNPYSMSRSGITTFGAFSVGDAVSSLPVQLLNLSAHVSSNDVVVNWSTASEFNNSHFEVERSVDGQTYAKAGLVEGKGYSSEVSNYSLTDKDILSQLKSGVLYYRLKQVDADGKASYFGPVAVNITQPVVALGVQVFPNPFSQVVTINVLNSEGGMMDVLISDMQGREVYRSEHQVSKGTASLKIDGLKDLKDGVYFMNATLNGTTQRVKLVKTGN